MTIEIKKRKKETVIRVTGVLDDVTAPALEKAISDIAKNTTIIILDLNGIDEISGEGLLALLKARKEMKEKGSLRLTGVCESVMQVIETTGGHLY